MSVLIFIVLLLIPILLLIVILDKYTKNKTSSQIMLIGIEVTIVGVAAIAYGGGGFSNDSFTTNLIGLIIVIIGLTSSVYGFIKK